METKFFQQVSDLHITGNLLITINTTNDIWAVSVLLNNEQCTDKAAKLILPFVLKGTPQDLDNGFFTSIAQPLQSTSKLLLNMEAFIKQQEVVKLNSAMEKEKTEKERKEKEAKEKKYKEAIAKADELEKAGKYREAWMKVPEANDYPEKTVEIRKRKSQLSDKFVPDLFAAAIPEEKPEQSQDGLYPEYSTDEVEEEMELSNEEDEENQY